MDEEITIADVLDMMIKNIAEPLGLEVDGSLRNAFDKGPLDKSGGSPAGAVLFRLWKGRDEVLARIYLVGERVSVRHLVKQEENEDLNINDPDLPKKLERHITLAIEDGVKRNG